MTASRTNHHSVAQGLSLAGPRVFAIQAIEQAIVSWPAYIKDASVNRGTHVLHFGGEYDSHLLVPKV